MPDELEIRRKFRKKKRKIEGELFAPSQQDKIDELEAGKRAGRVHCRRCKKYKEWSTLEAQLRRVKKNIFEMVWYCRDCGNAVLVKDYDVRRKKKDRTPP